MVAAPMLASIAEYIFFSVGNERHGGIRNLHENKREGASTADVSRAKDFPDGCISGLRFQ